MSQRTNEIGIRFAPGAESRSVVWLVMRQGLVLSAAGMCVGIPLSLAMTKLMSGVLLNTPSTDRATFTAVGATLVIIAAGACFTPARRVLSVDPVRALRV